MKKTMVIGLAIGLVGVAVTAFAVDLRPSTATNGALPTQGYTGQKNVGTHGILGSSHDMSGVQAGQGGGTNAGTLTRGIVTAGGGVADAQSRICVFCHHPHNAYSATAAGTAMEYSPLWNRVTTTNMTTYTGYNNGIMMGAANVPASNSDKRHALNAVDNGGTALGGVSILCMSCHDGATAMSAYSQTTGSTDNKGIATPNNKIGATATSSFENTNMNNHHPMGFNYAGVQAVDAEIAPVTAVMVPQSGIKIGDLLYGTSKKMECVTCHDVHNTANQAGAERFLWRSNNKSNFCLTCHLK